MASKGDHPGNDPKLKNERDLNRRDFVKTGVVAGLGSGALLEPNEVQAQVPATAAQDIDWDYEVDVVIAGRYLAASELGFLNRTVPSLVSQSPKVL